MNVTQLLSATFHLAKSQNFELQQKWIVASVRVGGLLPNSLLMYSVQRIGELDTVLRSIEAERSQVQHTPDQIDIFSLSYQSLLSDLWIGSSYEVVRLLGGRGIAPSSDNFVSLFQDLTMLRIPIEKHEIAQDRKLALPLEMAHSASANNERDSYIYDKGDTQRAHIMPQGTSARRSTMWHAIDVVSRSSKWLERLDLSERMLAIWD